MKIQPTNFISPVKTKVNVLSKVSFGYQASHSSHFDLCMICANNIVAQSISESATEGMLMLKVQHHK